MSMSERRSVLQEVVAKVLEVGATMFEVEYTAGRECVCAFKGPIGTVIAELESQSEDAESLRRELYDIGSKGKRIVISGLTYSLKSSVFDSFGEDAFRVTVRGC